MLRIRPAFVGIAVVAGAYAVFALHDACVKLLVADLPTPEILFIRSAVILACCVLADRRSPARALASPVRGALLGRGLILLAAWLCYYSAARYLQLAELVTIYYASPLMVAVLAVPMLGERVTWTRWGAIAIGFGGVVLACRPGDLHHPVAIGLNLLAATLWAYAIILIRQIARHEPTLIQMLLANSVFLVICGAMLPWFWRLPSQPEIALLLLVGVLGAGAQFLLYEGIKRAPATVAAPLEFTSLAWSVWLGYLIWGDLPRLAVISGAGLILVSGCVVVAGEWRSENRQARGSAPRPRQRRSL